MSVTTLRPTGDGSYKQWNPSPFDGVLYDKVNEAVADEDATYITVNTIGAKIATFTKDSILSGTPVSVTVNMRARIAGVNPSYLDACLIIGGVRYLSAHSSVSSTSYADFTKTWATNPATGGLWTLDDINNLEFGVHRETISEDRVTQVWMEVEMVDQSISVEDTGSGAESPAVNAAMSVPDYGVAQQEAVGMGAVYDPSVEGASVNASMTVPDTGAGVDAIASLLASMSVADIGAGTDAAGVNASMIVLDDGGGTDAVVMVASIPVADAGSGLEATSMDASIAVAETGAGVDTIAIGKAYFFITSEGILQPLGVIVLRDSREELLPSTRDLTDTVPGRHGEIDFGTEFNPRILELHVVKKSELTRGQWETVKRTLAKWLNPVLGVQNLIFADDVDRTYKVKFAGKIDYTRQASNYSNWLEFTIPFKAGDPFIIGSFEKTQVGSGTLTNEGTYETPMVIEIAGPVTDPEVQVGDDTLSWTGTVDEGETLEIDTEYMTVKLDGVNALDNYTGGFPKLQVGDTVVVAAVAGTTTFTWRDRWI